ncbi:MAG TPA: ribose-phosphate diphosphokinase [Bradyrhizobium sp.]|uniref:ribose-phosphate diphosphokinase n=1 Tax=Bradyrhizobium sp. TaxID=376 RepID=UPI002D7FE6EE|nr:ribose-phosphate diphosphokinase [Bradyrhizobium sp.]HET7887557.1 ribose-phosphate diphosphokinase [Bradyrhizobium sp.]
MQSLPDSAGNASRLASQLGIPFHEIALHWFPDRETRVTVGPSAPTTILYASLDQPNDKLIALLFACEALRRAGTRRLVLLAPYLCYMRQDVAFSEGEAISQKAIGRLLTGLADRIITTDAHLHRTHDIRTIFPGIEAENLSAMPAIANTLRRSGLDPATIVIGPDKESEPWVSDLAGRLGLSWTVAQKVRHGDKEVEISFSDPASMAARPALLVDDIVSSGATLIACARALAAAGATTVDAVITHALFPAALTSSFTAAGIRSVRSTTSVSHPTNAIPLDDIFAAALRRELDGDGCPGVKA